MRRSFLTLSLTLLGFAGAQAVAPTPAGTEILNRASATFDPPFPGAPVDAVSNTVSTTVRAVCAVTITPGGTVAAPGQNAVVLPGERAVFAYRVTNVGNSSFSAPITARTENASAFTPRLRLVLDRNGDGQPDDTSLTQLTLQAGESASVLLVVNTDADSRGDAFVNVLTACAGNEPDDNVSRVQVGEPPAFVVAKQFSPPVMRPGDETEVTVSTRNTGAGSSREVVLTDDLTAQAERGLVYVPGSARADGGLLEYSADGVSWSAAEPGVVRALRVRAPGLEPGAALALSFRMRALASAEGTAIENVATVDSGGFGAEGRALVQVRFTPGVAIGPIGNPLAPEDTEEDTQTAAFAVLGQPVCFDHTLRNTGNVRDRYTVTVAYERGAAETTLFGAGGEPLAQPIALEVGEEATVRACHTVTEAGPLTALLTASGERGTSNRTRDVVTRVETTLPELNKVSDTQGRAVAQGDRVTYTLTVANPYPFPLTAVTVRDALPAAVDFVTADGGGTVGGPLGAQVVTWVIGTLPPGESRRLSVTVRVSERALDGELLTNTFVMTANELPAGISSNEATAPVWSAALLIEKTVSSPQAAPGDRLNYSLRLRNLSTAPLRQVTVTDTPARGLAYLPGTSRLDGAPIPDPVIEGGVLRWTLESLAPGARTELTYAVRVTAEASGELVNTVQAIGEGAGGMVRVSSNVSTAVARLRAGVLAPQGDIVGVVYFDRDRDGRFDPEVDTPLAGVRVLLAGGRQALTDAAGRYHFAGVPLGAHALRLDPSVPHPALPHPQDGGLPGTRTAFVRGLTGVDFPLAAPEGRVGVGRRTTVVSRGVTVEKTVTPVSGGALVTLRLSSPAALPEFWLEDPLPAGATLRSGEPGFRGPLPAGVTVLTYRFDTPTENPAVTDPLVRWSRP